MYHHVEKAILIESHTTERICWECLYLLAFLTCLSKCPSQHIIVRHVLAESECSFLYREEHEILLLIKFEPENQLPKYSLTSSTMVLQAG